MKSWEDFKEEMMSTGSDANAAGFSHESPKEGPTAGLTAPFMQGMVTRSSKSNGWIPAAIAQSKKKKYNGTKG
tara:strand:- start:40 stop:258 length:219 start_codon:yes stop_codon:yes gene_type:complete